MQRVFVYGVTAVGKSTWAKKLSQAEDLPYIDGDNIRKQEYLFSEAGIKDVFAKIGTKSAWKMYGERTPENIRRGLRDLRKGINAFMLERIKDKPNFVFDAAYIDPQLCLENAEVYLLVCRDEASHRRRMFTRDKLDISINEERLANARALQEVFIEEAQRLNIQIIDIPEAI